jgi:hypothetical protein
MDPPLDLQEQPTTMHKFLVGIGQTVIGALILTAILAGVGFSVQLATIQTNLTGLKDDLKSNQSQLKESIKDAESRLSKPMEEVAKDIRRVDKDVSQLKGQMETLTRLAGQTSGLGIRSWLLAIAPDQFSSDPTVRVYLVDALQGTIKSWDPFPMGPDDQQNKAIVMGKFWAVAKGADSASDTIEHLIPIGEASELNTALWAGCSFGLSISPEEIPANLTAAFFVGSPRTMQGIGNRPDSLERLPEFIKGNQLVPN